jgi:hypothetical protein
MAAAQAAILRCDPGALVWTDLAAGRIAVRSTAPVKALEDAVPALIGAATLLFAFADRIKRHVQRRRHGTVVCSPGIPIAEPAHQCRGSHSDHGAMLTCLQ